MPWRPRRPSWSAWSAAGPPRPRRRPPRRSPGRRFASKPSGWAAGSRSTVRVDPEPAAPLPAGQWPSVRGEPLRPSGPTVLKLTVLATIDPIGISPIRMEGRVWFDPATGTPLRTIRSREGSDDYAQWFVFGREGVFRRQHEPLDRAQAAGPPEQLDARERERLRRPGRRRPLPVAGRDLDAGLPHVELGRAGHLRARPAVRLPQAPASPRALPNGAAGAGRLRLPGATRRRGRAARGIDRRGDHPA